MTLVTPSLDAITTIQPPLLETIANTQDPLAQYLAATYYLTYLETKKTLQNPRIKDNIQVAISDHVDTHTQHERSQPADELEQITHIGNNMYDKLALALALVCCKESSDIARHFFDEIVEAIAWHAKNNNLQINNAFLIHSDGENFNLHAIGTPRAGLVKLANEDIANVLRAYQLKSESTILANSSLEEREKLNDLYNQTQITATSLAYIELYAEIIAAIIQSDLNSSYYKINPDANVKDISLLIACACVLPDMVLKYEDRNINISDILGLLEPRENIIYTHPLYSQYVLFKMMQELQINTEIAMANIGGLRKIQLGGEYTRILEEINIINKQMATLNAKLRNLQEKKRELLKQLE